MREIDLLDLPQVNFFKPDVAHCQGMHSVVPGRKSMGSASCVHVRFKDKLSIQDIICQGACSGNVHKNYGAVRVAVGVKVCHS